MLFSEYASGGVVARCLHLQQNIDRTGLSLISFGKVTTARKGVSKQLK
jgi:hypothetical protein